MLDRYSKAEAASKQLSKELEERKELVKTLYTKHQFEKQVFADHDVTNHAILYPVLISHILLRVDHKFIMPTLKCIENRRVYFLYSYSITLVFPTVANVFSIFRQIRRRSHFAVLRSTRLLPSSSIHQGITRQ